MPTQAPHVPSAQNSQLVKGWGVGKLKLYYLATPCIDHAGCCHFSRRMRRGEAPACAVPPGSRDSVTWLTPRWADRSSVHHPNQVHALVLGSCSTRYHPRMAGYNSAHAANQYRNAVRESFQLVVKTVAGLKLNRLPTQTPFGPSAQNAPPRLDVSRRHSKGRKCFAPPTDGGGRRDTVSGGPGPPPTPRTAFADADP